MRLERWGVLVSIIGFIVASISLGLNYYNKSFLEKRIEKLEIRYIEGLFTIEQPTEHSTLPAKKETILKGSYVRAIPEDYKVVAVLQNGQSYYVSRARPVLETDRKWSLVIRPWPADEWKIIICLATEYGDKEIRKWAKETTVTGEINWDNPRNELPLGVIKNSTFIFSAKE